MDELPLITAKVVAATYLFLSLSLIMRPAIWTDFVLAFKERKTGAIPFSLVALPFGLIIVFTHPIYSLTPPLIITVMGWMIVLKHSFYVVFPKHWPSAKLFPMTQKFLVKYMRTAGIVLLLVSLAMIYFSFVDTHFYNGSFFSF